MAFDEGPVLDGAAPKSDAQASAVGAGHPRLRLWMAARPPASLDAGASMEGRE